MPGQAHATPCDGALCHACTHILGRRPKQGSPGAARGCSCLCTPVSSTMSPHLWGGVSIPHRSTHDLPPHPTLGFILTGKACCPPTLAFSQHLTTVQGRALRRSAGVSRLQPPHTLSTEASQLHVDLLKCEANSPGRHLHAGSRGGVGSGELGVCGRLCPAPSRSHSSSVGTCGHQQH